LNSLLSNYGTYPSWAPYKARVVQEAITFGQNNVFTANRYVGDWRFNPYEMSRLVDLVTWQSAPYNQDAGSSVVGASTPVGEVAVQTPIPPKERGKGRRK
jgi:hypothetical protein